jgi:hypothetical protein
MSLAHSLPLVRGDTPILHESFTSFGADVDLTSRSGRPPHAAQRVEVFNAEATVQDIVLKDIAGNNATYEIQPTSVRVIDGAFTAIESTGTQTISSVVAHWWMAPGYRLNP